MSRSRLRRAPPPEPAPLPFGREHVGKFAREDGDDLEMVELRIGRSTHFLSEATARAIHRELGEALRALRAGGAPS